MRTILHSDMNSCYASIELLHRPELRGKPMAVGGDPEARHGIVLAKDQLAKKAGVQTGMALWQARQVCPEIIFVPPDMDKYLRFSRLAHEIYGEYTDQQEAFGIDESWLDVTASASYKGDGYHIAQEISKRIKFELGITVSIGVSWNKIFAKLGSDYKKPDAITVISRENYDRIVRPLPVGDLLYVGRATERKLRMMNIHTIGELADADPKILKARLGKMGLVLNLFAKGEDQTPVMMEHKEAPIKSIGNSTTTPRDLLNDEDVKIILYVLSESVSERLRQNNFKCNVVEISVRDNGLFSFTRQMKVSKATDVTNEIAIAAMKLFVGHYHWEKPIRSVGVRACNLVDAMLPTQVDLFLDEEKRVRLHKMDLVVDDVRRRFGFDSIQRGMMYQDKGLMHTKSNDNPEIHPHGYFENGNRTGVEKWYAR